MRAGRLCIAIQMLLGIVVSRPFLILYTSNIPFTSLLLAGLTLHMSASLTGR